MLEKEAGPADADEEDNTLDTYFDGLRFLRDRFVNLELSRQDYLESLKRLNESANLSIGLKYATEGDKPTDYHRAFLFMVDYMIKEQEEELRRNPEVKINFRGGLKELAAMLSTLEAEGKIDHVEDKDVAKLFTIHGTSVNANSLKTIRNRDW